ncbi:MAG TPA: UDP-N-acetylmuramate dehydrogenase [Gammaproteobacteria bacterium]
MSELETFDVRRDEPMRKHTSWRVGGPADLFFEPADEAVLERFLRALPADLPVCFVGLGSNLLVRDGGIRGAVISTRRLAKRLVRVGDERVIAGAGLPCARLARQSVQWKLGPAAFFAGIPGTVGGALAMNAGAFGGETWNNVEAVEIIDRRGDRRTLPRAAFSIGYRTVRLAPPVSDTFSEKVSDTFSAAGLPFWFLAATFRFERDETLDMSVIKTMLEKRGATQPLGVPSCGSVFRNPEGAHAGALIEQAGLKGLAIGGARVSEKHANFIVNTGGAAADDIEQLIETVRRRVEERTGVVLELEARVIGERRREGR